MMALATYKLQVSCSTLPSGPSSWSRGSKLKHSAKSLVAVGNKDRFISLKCRSCSSVGASALLGSNSKSFKISAFKGGNRRDESGGRSNGSNSLENPLKVSYLRHQSEESSVESSKAQNTVPYTSADETTSSSLAIHKLFKSWLMLLRVPPQPQPQPQPQPKDEVVEEPFSSESSEVPKTVQKQERSVILKSVWCYFLGLDAAIKLPLLIFGPIYLAVNIVYGRGVSKELGPLWIFGPLVVALYIKTFEAICAIYAFTFKETVNIIKNIPVYYSLTHDYIVSGKLREAIRKYTWQPFEDLMTMDYKAVTLIKLKDFQGWIMERYLDFVESIWPYYCRMIRFLKRANLI